MIKGYGFPLEAYGNDGDENFKALADSVDNIAPGVQGPMGPQGLPGTNGTDGTNGTKDSPDTADQVREKFISGTSCSTDPNNPNDIMVKIGPLCIDKYEASVWLFPNGNGTQLGATADDYGLFFPDNGNWRRPQ